MQYVYEVTINHQWNTGSETRTYEVEFSEEEMKAVFLDSEEFACESALTDHITDISLRRGDVITVKEVVKIG